MVAVPAELAERERIKAENARARRARYEANRPGRSHHLPDKSHHRADEIHYRDYPFVMWDGEAPTDTGYSLFGSSLGHSICKPHLTTEECFDLLLSAKAENPWSIFFWFGGRYDWDEITRQSIPLYKLNRLKTAGTLWWHGYRLTEIEGKVYTIQKDGISVKIYEVSGWFHTTYAKALRDYGVGCDGCIHRRENCGIYSDLVDKPCACKCRLCRIELGKSRRGTQEFLWDDIEEITRYMFDELACGPDLMDSIRQICLNAGFNPHAWYGPSALARELLTKNKIYDSMAECPPAVNIAAQYGFAGGRFENFRGGIIQRKGKSYDKNSAYMHAALDLPNLAKGTWREGRQFESGKFAIYNISYTDKQYTVTKPQPLFRRHSNGNVTWPRRVTGWYWSPEAELVKDDPGAIFRKAYIFDEDNIHDRPFLFVQELYRKRMFLASLPNDNPSRQAEKAFKWALASIFGQLCRIVGWDRKNRKAPKTHQLEWAGYITSHCRAAMYKLAMAAGDDLVSIDTDSVTSLAELDVREGKQLGEWKTEQFDGGIFFQSGVYFTLDSGVWSKGKTRGMERRQNNSAAVSPGLLEKAIKTNSQVKLTPKKRYITTRMAINGQLAYHGTWRDHPGNILEFGGGGKRYHNTKFCERYCDGDIHVFLPSLAGHDTESLFDTDSDPHYLPWKSTDDEHKLDTRLIADLLWVDSENIDTDDEWQAELIGPKTNGSHMVSAKLRSYGENSGESARKHNGMSTMQSELVAQSLYSSDAL